MNFNIKDRNIRWIISISCAVISSLIQVYALQVFVKPSNFLSSGFTGLSILINKISSLYYINFPISLGIILLNIPCVILCIKGISFKFTIISCIQLILTSILLPLFDFKPIFTDVILNCIIGGVIYGFSVVIALFGDGSTGGLDFISVYVSNKIGKSTWSYVFIFNMIMLIIFGVLFGYQYAGYSILFQYISTKTIEKFHHRYEQVTLQVTTTKANEIIDEYVKYYKHGITVTKSYGGYSKVDNYICHTVVSGYEVKDIINLFRSVDNKVIVNVFKTENFYGGFYRKPID